MQLRIKPINYYYYGPWSTVDKTDNILQYQNEDGHWLDVPKEKIEYVNLKSIPNS